MRFHRMLACLALTFALPLSAWSVDAPRTDAPKLAPKDSANADVPKKNDPTKWEKDIAKFEASDKANPPKKGQVLFVGSSSIRLWNLKKSFPDLDAINRGFGGSQIEDSTYFAGRIVLPYQPRLIVMYAGDNDIASGKSPTQVADDFKAFVAKVRGKAGDTSADAKAPAPAPIIYIAIKPSIARWKLVDKVREANKLIREFCEKGDKLTFLDIETPMIGDDGKPKAELFVKDNLHLSEAGYKMWDELLKPHLDKK